MGLTSAQRYNRMSDRIWADKAKYDKLAEEAAVYEYANRDMPVTEWHNVIVHNAHVEALEGNAIYEKAAKYEREHVAKNQYTETVTVELAHREALAENIERDTLSNIEETQRMDAEADEREQIADDLEAVAAFMDEHSNTQEQ